MFRVASVPYVNARPLVAALERFGWADVCYAVPSDLPALLESGEADAILVSSYDALSVPGRAIAAGCAIASLGAAASVRLFSQVPFGEIRTLALDRSSLTSNHLAAILLAERHGVSPRCETAAPDLRAMLLGHDACVLIGDPGMEADGSGLHVMDLGREWTEFAGLPFVWAAWVGRGALSPDLARVLNEARAWGQDHFEALIPEAAKSSGWSEERVRQYFVQTMNYDLTPRHLEGLRLFRSLLEKHGMAPSLPFPEIVGEAAAV